jgi:CspA family cold shock protein
MGTCTGTVKWFDPKKGYGFIKRDDGKPDVFLHARNLERSRYPGFPDDPPDQGDKICFDVEVGDRGEFATNLTPG